MSGENMEKLVGTVFMGALSVVFICVAAVAVFIAAYWIKCLMHMISDLDTEDKK